METRKIAIACFIGGALCCAIALMFAPIYWWFGLIAGMAGGYISYEFREVRKAIPIALAAARRGSASAWDNAIASTKAWFSRPHPFFYFGALLALPLTICFRHYEPEPLLLIIAYGEMAGILGVLFFCFALMGAEMERCYWVPTMRGVWEILEMQRKGYNEVHLTYIAAARWAVKEVLAITKFLAWTTWKCLTIGVWTMPCFFGRFVRHLFILIHSEKRVLCTIDGTLGGAMSYIWLASAHMSSAEQAVLVIFGGLLGAAFGVANWELVSKRILRVPVNGT